MFPELFSTSTSAIKQDTLRYWETNSASTTCCNVVANAVGRESVWAIFGSVSLRDVGGCACVCKVVNTKLRALLGELT